MKMLHVTIRTPRFEEEIRFFEEVAGLTIVNDMRRFGAQIVFLANAEGETCIEVIDAPDGGSAGNEQLSIGFETDDVELKRAELEADGWEVTPMISPNPQVHFFFVTDPAGVKVQFM